MRRLIFSPASEIDIDQIWDFSADRWSIKQADRYTDDIRQACNDLINLRSSVAMEGHGEYRKTYVGSHVIFFRSNDEELVIVRILHQRMDESLIFEDDN